MKRGQNRTELHWILRSFIKTDWNKSVHIITVKWCLEPKFFDDVADAGILRDEKNKSFTRPETAPPKKIVVSIMAKEI